jgi:hypothetical protein
MKKILLRIIMITKIIIGKMKDIRGKLLIKIEMTDFKKK